MEAFTNPQCWWANVNACLWLQGGNRNPVYLWMRECTVQTASVLSSPSYIWVSEAPRGGGDGNGPESHSQTEAGQGPEIVALTPVLGFCHSPLARCGGSHEWQNTICLTTVCCLQSRWGRVCVRELRSLLEYVLFTARSQASSVSSC